MQESRTADVSGTKAEFGGTRIGDAAGVST